jgi:hypothetical protein
MKSLYGLLQDITAELGYNPYQSFQAANGDIINFAELDCIEDGKKLTQTITYWILRSVREAGLGSFYSLVQPFPIDDVQIVGLMIEIYRRTQSTSEVSRFYFSETQWIDFDGWDDLNDALNQVRRDFPWLNAYTPINGGIAQNYQAMSDQHLLNAWFQRMYNSITKNPPSSILPIETDALRVDCPQLDGILMALAQFKSLIS